MARERTTAEASQEASGRGRSSSKGTPKKASPSPKKVKSVTVDGSEVTAISIRSPSPARQRKPKPVSKPSEDQLRASTNTSHHEHEVEMEFGGPVGAFFIIVGLPAVIFLLFYLSNKNVCLTFNFSAFSVDSFLGQLPDKIFGGLVTWTGVYMVLGWMSLQVLLERILPGETADGVKLSTGQRLPYTMSGHLQFWLSLAILLFAYPKFEYITNGVDNSTNNYTSLVLKEIGSYPLYVIYDNYVSLAGAAIILSAILSVYLYITSFKRGALLAVGGNTGSTVYDFFIGRFALLFF